MLSDYDLELAIRQGAIHLEPPATPEAIQPSSIDVRLDHQFRTFTNTAAAIDTRNPPPDLTTLKLVPDGQPFRLHPGEFVLGSTLEVVTLDASHTVKLDGRSSLGRLGLVVHSTAGLIDAGFSGQITLELSNVGPLPLDLWPGQRIAQLCVYQLSSPAHRPYGSTGVGRYQGQRGPTASLGVPR